MITKSNILGLVLALIGWVSINVFTMVISPSAPAALILFPSQAFIQSLPHDARILDHSRHSITLEISDSSYGSLYENGARLVFPAGLTGCVPISAIKSVTT